jgi:2',5'-phosphodiesterase
MPPLEAVRAQVALPNAEFPSDHLPMVADLEHV